MEETKVSVHKSRSEEINLKIVVVGGGAAGFLQPLQQKDPSTRLRDLARAYK